MDQQRQSAQPGADEILETPQAAQQPSAPDASAYDEAVYDESAYSEVYLEPIDDLGFADVPEEEPPVRLKFNKSKKKKRTQRKRAIIALACCAVALLTLIVVYYFAEQQKRQAAEIASQLAAEEALRVQMEQERVEYEAMTSSTVFAEGISVDGVEIGGMTKQQATTALQPIVTNLHSARELQLSYGAQLYSLDLGSIVTSNDLNAVLDEAFQLGKSGEYEALKTELDDIKTNGRTFSLTASYDLTALNAKVAELAAQIDKPMQNASVSKVNTEDNTIEFADPVTGVAVEQQALVERITESLKTGGLTPVEIPVLETQPVVTKEMLSAQYVKRASATTDFSSSSSDRKYNVRKGAGMITGTILKPGEEFSTNDALGTRTISNGWKSANAYESGAVVPQAGGGVCQLSTTLYNAVVKGDLEVVYRRNHSMPVAYVDEGLDATINSVGNIIDFKFKNNTDSDIVIFAYTTDNKKLTFEIWGVPFATTEYDEIKLSSKLVETYNPEGETVRIEVPEGTEKPNGSLMAMGEEYVAVASRKGYKYQSYKNYYKNGTLVRSEALASSTYKAYAGEIWVVPMTDVTLPDGLITPDPYFPVVDPVIPDFATPEPFIPDPVVTTDPFADLPAGAF